MTVGCAAVAIIQNGISVVGLDSFYQHRFRIAAADRDLTAATQKFSLNRAIK